MKNGSNSDSQDESLSFFGEFEHTLDSQRRLAIPGQWRKKKGVNQFFLVPGRNNILQLIPFESFKNFLDKARKISFADAKLSLALAQFGAKAQECVCDKQGRIPIPQRLLDYAGLKNQVMLIGSVSTIQIWHPDKWNALSMGDEGYLDLVQQIGEENNNLMDIIQGALEKKK